MKAVRAWIGSLVLLLFCGTLTAQDTTINAVRISFGVGKHTFPKRWQKKKIHAEAVPVEEALMPAAKSILSKAFSKYPALLPSSCLTEVHVFKSLQFYGYPYGGTYSKRTLYLTYDPANPLSSDRYLEERFHHEFSSILWRENHQLLDLNQWMSFNPPGFTYGEGGADAIREGIASMETDPGYFGIGFLNRYAMTEIEQDINVIAQNLFCGGPGFWKIVDGNERIRGKVMLLVGFYHSIDPRFTEDYFHTLD